MANVTLFGATGYAGRHILNELLARGHHVLAVARKVDTLPQRDRLVVKAGSISNANFARDAVAGADVVVLALPAVDVDGKPLAHWIPALLDIVQSAGARIGMVGGAGSLHEYEGGPRHDEMPEFPAFLKPIVAAHDEVLKALQHSNSAVDWFYFSPAAGFSPYTPGEKIGHYRIGGTILVKDNTGNSFISAQDYASAFVDEIESPVHHRVQLTAAY